MVPADDAVGRNVRPTRLGACLRDHRLDLGADRAEALEQGHAVPRHLVGIALDLDVALHHHAAQLVVVLAVLDLERRVRVALEVLGLLRLRVGPAAQRGASATYQSGIRCGRPFGPIVAQVTTFRSPRKACSSSSDMLIWSRRDGTPREPSGLQPASASEPDEAGQRVRAEVGGARVRIGDHRRRAVDADVALLRRLQRDAEAPAGQAAGEQYVTEARRQGKPAVRRRSSRRASSARRR